MRTEGHETSSGEFKSGREATDRREAREREGLTQAGIEASEGLEDRTRTGLPVM
jgi:hypothetical protein